LVKECHRRIIRSEHTLTLFGEGADIKKGINLVLEDAQIVGLIRILLDDDAEDALKFLKVHFKGKVPELLEGG
jgi:hypothetical protein